MGPEAHDSTDQMEADLLEQLRRGDEGKFEQLVRKYGGRMLATARRILNDESAAEDCVQEAFLNAFRGINNFQGRSTIGTWLHRITINAALSKVRSLAKTSESSVDDLLPEFDQNGCRIEPNWNFQDDIEERINRQEIRDMVISKINELPDDYRIVLMLRDIEDLSTFETAETIRISEGAVKTRLHRARSMLKKLLEPVFEVES